MTEQQSAAASPGPVLHEPREPVPALVSDSAALLQCVESIAGGEGPLAVDVERAGGYRYTQRAYLLQFRRRGSGTWLIDPVAVPDLTELAAVINQQEWVLHAANQDLPSLRELHLNPTSLFDTELAGRLLNLDRVGLAAITEHYLGYGLAKAHSAADWSTRPLPQSWLTYAALDVEPLLDLRTALAAELAAADRLHWAEQEFAHLLAAPPPQPRSDPWRRTKGLKVRTPRALAIVRELWKARDEVARASDRAPGRVLPDAAIAALVQSQPRTLQELLAIPQLRRQPKSQNRLWLDAISRALALDNADLPSKRGDTTGIPSPRSWDRVNPIAALAHEAVREVLTETADQLEVPRENLLPPRAVRQTVWTLANTEASASGAVDTLEVRRMLIAAGAREWQVDLTATPFTQAFVQAVDQSLSEDTAPVTTTDITDQ